MQSNETIELYNKEEPVLGSIIMASFDGSPSVYYTIVRAEMINGEYKITANNKRYAK
jgi:hypothetical protein